MKASWIGYPHSEDRIKPHPTGAPAMCTTSLQSQEPRNRDNHRTGIGVKDLSALTDGHTSRARSTIVVLNRSATAALHALSWYFRGAANYPALNGHAPPPHPDNYPGAILRLSQSQSVSGRSAQGCAASSCALNARITASPCGGPTSCIPIGSPLE